MLWRWFTWICFLQGIHNVLSAVIETPTLMIQVTTMPPRTAVECTSYSFLSSGDRKTTYSSYPSSRCDKKINGWYRFLGAAGTRMPTSCPPIRRCNTDAPGWLNGGHPTVADGKVTRQVCFHWFDGCCHWSTNIEVRNCGSFYVYHFSAPPACHLRYCGSN